jgi:hypothetical protein
MSVLSIIVVSEYTRRHERNNETANIALRNFSVLNRVLNCSLVVFLLMAWEIARYIYPLTASRLAVLLSSQLY